LMSFCSTSIMTTLLASMIMSVNIMLKPLISFNNKSIVIVLLISLLCLKIQMKKAPGVQP
jgi:hypothetical protein